MYRRTFHSETLFSVKWQTGNIHVKCTMCSTWADCNPLLSRTVSKLLTLFRKQVPTSSGFSILFSSSFRNVLQGIHGKTGLRKFYLLHLHFYRSRPTTIWSLTTSLWSLWKCKPRRSKKWKDSDSVMLGPPHKERSEGVLTLDREKNMYGGKDKTGRKAEGGRSSRRKKE